MTDRKSKNHVYCKVIDAIQGTRSKLLIEILKRFLTIDDCEVILALRYEPEPLEKVAERLREDPKTARKRLEKAISKGVCYFISTAQDVLYRRQPLFAIVETLFVDGRDRQLGDDFRAILAKYWNEEFIHKYYDVEKPRYRIIPVEKSIPFATLVIPYQYAADILRRAKRIVLLRCTCRSWFQRCDNPVETCMLLDDAAEYYQARGSYIKELTVKESLEILHRTEELGLIHATDNVAEDAKFLCSCCPCCCVVLRGLIAYGKRKAVAKSLYVARVDESKCTGCGECVKRCYFGAAALHGGKRRVDAEKCFGCGACAWVCKNNAIALVPVRESMRGPSSA
ncbi:TPA: hypothetical protein EYP44_00720 [Candidatus Bathyarchaeota archaeon]|nr:hypothetical protein [Candidatus Bathyarchaeota archaeon]